MRINDGDHFVDISHVSEPIDVLFEHSISYSRGLYVSKTYETMAVTVVNTPLVAEHCGDKYVTSQIFVQNNVPIPRVFIAFDEASALNAVNAMGYLCVLKPVIGSGL